MRKIVLLMIAASGAISAMPAAAQPWRIQPAAQQQIRSDIAQLETQIDRAQKRRTISGREAAGLRREAADARQLLARYSRNGLSRAEVAQLEREVNQVRRALRLERRDWDGQRG